MNKVIRSTLSFVGVVATAWWLGGMMYFILVAKHFRDEENRENASKNIASYIRSVGGHVDGDKPSVPPKGDKRKQTAPRPIRDPYPYPNWAKESADPKWRSFYRPGAGWDSKGLRPGETGWDS